MRPYLTNGFWHDDRLNSLLAGELGRTGESLAHTVAGTIAHWSTKEGRFYPLSAIFGAAGNYWIRPVELFRLVQVLLVGVNILMFAWILRRLGVAQRFVWLWVAMLPLCFQITFYHDAIGAYGFIMQLSALFFCVTLGALVAWLDAQDAGRTRAAAIAMAVCLSSSVVQLLLYEVSLACYPVYLVVIACRRRGALRQGARLVGALGLPLLLYLGCCVYLRATATGVYSGIALGGVSKIAVTTLKQLFGAVPLSYYWARLHESLPGHIVRSKMFVSWDSIPIALCCLAGVAYLLSRRDVRVTAPAPVSLWSMGLVLAVAPAALMGMSSRFQNELKWGEAYLPVYLSCFGVALLLACAFERAMRGFRTAGLAALGAGALAVAFAGLFMVNRTVNDLVAEQQNRNWRTLRLPLEAAFEQGLLAELVDGDRLVVTPRLNWLESAFIYLHAKKRPLLEGLVEQNAKYVVPTGRAYALRYTASTTGWAALLYRLVGTVDAGTALASDAVCKIAADQVTVLAQGESGVTLSNASWTKMPDQTPWLRRLYRGQLSDRVVRQATMTGHFDVCR